MSGSRPTDPKSKSKPLVVIVGGTGEDLPGNQNQLTTADGATHINALNAAKNKIEELNEEFENQLKLQEKEKKAYLDTLTIDTPSMPKTQDNQNNSAPPKGNKSQKLDLNDLLDTSDDFNTAPVETDAMKAINSKLAAIQADIIVQMKVLNNLNNNTYALFMPPIDNPNEATIKLVRGARANERITKLVESVQKKEKRWESIKALKARDFVSKKTRDFISYASEGKRIKEFIAELKAADPLPERIILSGHSRGASMTIALANAIYSEFGEGPPKIALHLSDPVPGFGRHKDKRMVLPPNVDSAIINYAGEETGKLFQLQKVYFDPRVTTVTTKIYPMDHVFNSTSSDANMRENILAEITDNNKQMYNAFTGKTIQVKDKTHSDNAIKGSGSRENMVLSVATDPALNKNLEPDLKELHVQLQKPIDTKKRLKTNFFWNQHAANLVDTSKMAAGEKKRNRKKNLQLIRQNAKNERKHQHQEDPQLDTFLRAVYKWQEEGAQGKSEDKQSDGNAIAKKDIAKRFSDIAENLKLNMDVKCLSQGNNVVMRLTDKLTHESIILTSCALFRNNQDAIDILLNSQYAAKEYYSKSNVAESILIVAMEDIPNSAMALAKETDSEKRINNAINVGSQIFSLLQYLNEKKVTWTDLKPENILLRADGSIAIPDKKCFAASERPPILKDMSMGYLPPAQKIAISDHTSHDAETWRSIYAYQLAVILYHQATGQLVVQNSDDTSSNNPAYKKLHDFSNPAFNTPAGERLKFIIKALSGPGQQMQLSDAAKLLDVCHDAEKYKVVLQGILCNRPDLKQHTYNKSPPSQDPYDRANIVLVHYENLGKNSDKYSSDLQEIRSKLDEMHVKEYSDPSVKKKELIDLMGKILKIGAAIAVDHRPAAKEKVKEAPERPFELPVGITLGIKGHS